MSFKTHVLLEYAVQEIIDAVSRDVLQHHCELELLRDDDCTLERSSSEGVASGR